MTRPAKRGTFRRSCRRCGWTGTYTTAGRGDYAKRKHSCERQIAATARAENGRRRMADIDRTPKPCHHKKATHQHGTNAAYVLDKCRCIPCAEARHRTDDERRRLQAYGRYDRYVDADLARTHVRSLMASGMGIKRISATSGVSTGVLWKLLYGKPRPDGTRTPSRRLVRATHDRLVAVQLDLADGAVVDHTGTTRRIRALVALGWSQSKIAGRLGIARSNFILAKGDRNVTVATARTIADLYDELSMQQPPEDSWRDRIAASRARRYAAQRGWLPPLAIDDEHLDDPAWMPESIAADDAPEDLDLDEIAIARRMDGDRTVELTLAEKDELVALWLATGRSLASCERVTGVNVQRHKPRPATDTPETPAVDAEGEAARQPAHHHLPTHTATSTGAAA